MAVLFPAQKKSVGCRRFFFHHRTYIYISAAPRARRRRGADPRRFESDFMLALLSQIISGYIIIIKFIIKYK